MRRRLVGFGLMGLAASVLRVGPYSVAASTSVMPAPSLSICLLIDASSSVRADLPSQWGFTDSFFGGGPLRQVGVAPPVWAPVAAFAESLETGDRVIVSTVTDRLNVAPGVATDGASFSSALATALNRADHSVRTSGSPIWDATDKALAYLAREPAPRAIVLLTDGKASGNHIGTEELAAHAKAAAVTINILLGRDGDEATLPTMSPSVPARALAQATGGIFVNYSRTVMRSGSPPREIEGPSVAMAQLMRSLRGRRAAIGQ